MRIILESPEDVAKARLMLDAVEVFLVMLTAASLPPAVQGRPSPDEPDETAPLGVLRLVDESQQPVPPTEHLPQKAPP